MFFQQLSFLLVNYNGFKVCSSSHFVDHVTRQTRQLMVTDQLMMRMYEKQTYKVVDNADAPQGSYLEPLLISAYMFDYTIRALCAS